MLGDHAIFGTVERKPDISWYDAPIGGLFLYLGEGIAGMAAASDSE